MSKEFEKKLLNAAPAITGVGPTTMNGLISYQLQEMKFRETCLNEIRVCKPNVISMREKWSTMCLLIGMFAKMRYEGEFDSFKMIGMNVEETVRAGEGLDLIRKKIALFKDDKLNTTETKRLYDQICAAGF